MPHILPQEEERPFDKLRVSGFGVVQIYCTAALKPKQLEGFGRYKAILARRTPDFQTKRGYPVTRPGKGNLAMATSQLAERFGPSHGCVAMTLEMPFKDHDDAPCPQQG